MFFLPFAVNKDFQKVTHFSTFSDNAS